MEILHEPKIKPQRQKKLLIILTSTFALTILLNIAFYGYVDSLFHTILEARVSRHKVVVMLTPLEQIDKLFTDAANKNIFSGGVLLAKNGNILFENAYGYVDSEKSSKNTINTKFAIASLTKAFTAAAILKLKDENKLSLNDPIIIYLPDYKYARQVTISQLLSHQSGIWNYPNNETKAPNPIKKQDLLKIVMSKPLIFKPGSRFMYSNSNYILLSAIIEKVSGKSYEEYIQNNILKPLEMSNTGFITTPAASKNIDTNVLELFEYTGNDLAQGMEYDSSNKALKPAEKFNLSHVWGAGSMYSNLDDLYTWEQSFYTNKILSKESLSLMFEPDKNKYGFAWNITTSRINLESKILIWHQGLISGYNSFIYRYPEDNVSVIILKNMENSTNNITDTAIKLFWTSLYQQQK